MGAVMNDRIVAILIKVPISDSKNTKIIIVTIDIIKIQVLYPLIFLWFNNFLCQGIVVVIPSMTNSSKDLFIL